MARYVAGAIPDAISGQPGSQVQRGLRPLAGSDGYFNHVKHLRSVLCECFPMSCVNPADDQKEVVVLETFPPFSLGDIVALHIGPTVRACDGCVCRQRPRR